MMKGFLVVFLAGVVGIVFTTGVIAIGIGFTHWVTGWPHVPESGWNDHYDGKLWKVVKSIPASEIVDQTKLKEWGGEKVYFFSKNGSAYPTDQEVYCVILRHPSRGVQIGE